MGRNDRPALGLRSVHRWLRVPLHAFVTAVAGAAAGCMAVAAVEVSRSSGLFSFAVVPVVGIALLTMMVWHGGESRSLQPAELAYLVAISVLSPPAAFLVFCVGAIAAGLLAARRAPIKAVLNGSTLILTAGLTTGLIQLIPVRGPVRVLLTVALISSVSLALCRMSVGTAIWLASGGGRRQWRLPVLRWSYPAALTALPAAGMGAVIGALAVRYGPVVLWATFAAGVPMAWLARSRERHLLHDQLLSRALRFVTELRNVPGKQGILDALAEVVSTITGLGRFTISHDDPGARFAFPVPADTAVVRPCWAVADHQPRNPARGPRWEDVAEPLLQAAAGALLAVDMTDRLRGEARRDPLTGLANRTGLH